MSEIKTLTINGKTYTVSDADSVSFEEEQDLPADQQARARANIGAASIDDDAVGPDAWSSQKTSEEMDRCISAAELETVDKLCPTFTESGSIVTCEPVEGYPLEVVTHDVSNPNLIPVDLTDEENWLYDEAEDVPYYVSPVLPSGVYTVYIETDEMFNVDIGAVDVDGKYIKQYGSAQGMSPMTFTHIGGAVRIDNYEGLPGAFIKLEAGTEYTGTNYTAATQITRCGKNLCTTDVVNLPGDGMNKTIWSGRLSAPLTVSADLSEVQGDFTHGGAFISYVVDGNTKYASLGSCGTGVKIESGTLTQMKVVNYGKFSGTARIRLETGLVKTAYEPHNGGTFAPGEPIPAISGVNTIYADAGMVTVTGKADPKAIIQEQNKLIGNILDRVASLEATIVSNT